MKKANKHNKRHSLSLCVNAASGQIIVRVIDNSSKDIVKEIHSLEINDIRDEITHMAGLLFVRKNKGQT